MGEVENEDTAVFSARFESGLSASFSVSRTAFGMPNGLAFDVHGLDGRASFDWHRPAEYLFDDRQPEARTRGARQVIAGPQMPYLPGGYPMEAPGVGGGNAEMFVYQCRAFLDQIVGTPDPLPPNATFADGLHTMQIIQAVRSEEHTSELQSRQYLVCRLLLEKKKKQQFITTLTLQIHTIHRQRISRTITQHNSNHTPTSYHVISLHHRHARTIITRAHHYF